MSDPNAIALRLEDYLRQKKQATPKQIMQELRIDSLDLFYAIMDLRKKGIQIKPTNGADKNGAYSLSLTIPASPIET